MSRGEAQLQGRVGTRFGGALARGAERDSERLRGEGRTEVSWDGPQRRPAGSPEPCSEFLSESTPKWLSSQPPRRLWGPRLETEVGLGAPGAQPGRGEGLAPRLRHRCCWAASLLWEEGCNERSKDGVCFPKEESPGPSP